MLKGLLDGVILNVIGDSGELYGYELNEKLQAYHFQELSMGTIYPLLQKLEKKKLIQSQQKQSADGPKRKYYSLTTLGAQERMLFNAQWASLSTIMQNIVGDNHEYWSTNRWK